MVSFKREEGERVGSAKVKYKIPKNINPSTLQSRRSFFNMINEVFNQLRPSK